MSENFIFQFQVPEDVCDKLIDYHKNNKDDKWSTQEQGRSPNQKEGIDVLCYPPSKNEVLLEYRKYLGSALEKYYIKYHVSPYHLQLEENFMIQYYPPNGGYKTWHNERDIYSQHQRSLVFMTYLNDVPDGGGTEFMWYPDFKINAKKGLSLIWPTDFTHTHRGVVSKHEKYIITGWFNHTYNSPPRDTMDFQIL